VGCRSSSGFTKVCVYDGPGTLLYTDPLRITDRSSPVQMSRTAQDVTSDLHALLSVAQLSGPHILVAHSLGGLFIRLYAQSYSDQTVPTNSAGKASTTTSPLIWHLWPEGAQELVKLEPDTPHIFATGRDHYIRSINRISLFSRSIRGAGAT
jgi:hypothetical protein